MSCGLLKQDSKLVQAGMSQAQTLHGLIVEHIHATGAGEYRATEDPNADVMTLFPCT